MPILVLLVVSNIYSSPSTVKNAYYHGMTVSVAEFERERGQKEVPCLPPVHSLMHSQSTLKLKNAVYRYSVYTQ